MKDMVFEGNLGYIIKLEFWYKMCVVQLCDWAKLGKKSHV